MGTAAVAELARHSRIIGLKDVRGTWLDYDVIACMYCSLQVCFTEIKLYFTECRCQGCQGKKPRSCLFLLEKWCTWYWWVFLSGFLFLGWRFYQGYWRPFADSGFERGVSLRLLVLQWRWRDWGKTIDRSGVLPHSMVKVYIIWNDSGRLKAFPPR